MKTRLKPLQRRLMAGLALGAALTVSACSDPAAKQNRSDQSMARAVFDQVMSRRAAKAQAPVDLAAVLQTADRALALIAFENNPASTLLQQAGTAGDAQIFETAQGQSVTAKRGFVIATRGLGQDLMATKANSVSHLIAHRRPGSGHRQMEMLNGAGEAVTFHFDCQIKRDRVVPIESGAINTSGRLMVEDCAGDSGSFRNTYVVSSDGYILGSRQWLHPLLGSATFQMLKR